jgi:hypothetical protein
VFMIGMHGVRPEIHASVCSVIKCLYGCHHCQFSLLTRLLKFIYDWKFFLAMDKSASRLAINMPEP